MDMKRYEEIDGLDALKRFSREEDVYNEIGYKLYIDDCKLWMVLDEVTGVVDLTIANILEGKWYVKKPFDVRTEMLARPNEWVAAYNDHRAKWIQVGFDTLNMHPATAYYGYTGDVEATNAKLPTAYELETCIPIEDVPKEELA